MSIGRYVTSSYLLVVFLCMIVGYGFAFLPISQHHLCRSELTSLSSSAASSIVNMENDGGVEETDDEKSSSGLIAKISGRLKTKKSSSAVRFCMPEEVVTIHEYKEQVVDEKDQMVVVRFYAPWCRACKAVQQPFRKLSRDFGGEKIKFVECPVTEENSFLHEGLGVPSLPYGHIYHPEAGLVEEVSINKKVFKDFERVLQYYVDGEGDVEYPDDGEPCVPAAKKKK